MSAIIVIRIDIVLVNVWHCYSICIDGDSGMPWFQCSSVTKICQEHWNHGILLYLAILCSGVDELRPIALTSVLSKLQESYVVSGLKEDIHGKLRRRSMVGGQGRRQFLLLYLVHKQWRSQPDNLVPLCKFDIIIVIIQFFRNWLFSQSIITKICIAGLNRRAGYATVHKWHVALDTPGSVIRIMFLDFRKAYDLIDHNIMLENCCKIGIRPALYPPGYMARFLFEWQNAGYKIWIWYIW